MITRKGLYSIVMLCLISFSGIAYAAQFWQAYCNTESKALGNWSNQEKVAENNKSHHLRNNPNHDVDINSK